jgi:hypothetical protein
MKAFISLLALVCFVPAAFSQKGQSAFGKINRSDLEIKDCSFDLGAEAFKLIDYGNLYYASTPDASFPIITMYERRIRIKILKPAGLSYGNIIIPYFSNENDEKIIKVEAYTFNLGEDHAIKKTIVGRKGIFSKKINKQVSEIIIVFPEVKVGSVIEYKYQLQQKSITEMKDWYFQSNIPTKFSEYQVNIPSFFRYTIHPLTSDSLEVSESEFSDGLLFKGAVPSSTVYQKDFILHNLPAIRREPFMGSVKDYLQRLSFSVAEIDFGNGKSINAQSDWEGVVASLMKDKDFGLQLDRSISETTGIVDSAKTLTGTESRMAFIFNYIKNNFQWNGQRSIYAYDGLKKIIKNKIGSSGDLNLLLIALLKQTGISALPVLFSTRDNGLVNTTLPVLNQFNTVMGLVEDNNKYYVLDAGNKFSLYNLIPAEVLNTKGFIVTPDKSRWLEVNDNTNKFKLTTAVSGSIDSNGTMKAEALVTSTGYARKQRCEDWVTNAVQFDEESLSGASNKIKITDLTIENLDDDTAPLEQKIKFLMDLGSTGELRYFNTNLFSGLTNNLFIASERRTDIDFGYQQEYNLYGNYTIPINYQFENLPANISLVMPDTSIVFKRFLNVDNNAINIRMTVEFRRFWYSVSEYAEFANFYKKLLSILNEQLIIKRKDPL